MKKIIALFVFMTIAASSFGGCEKKSESSRPVKESVKNTTVTTDEDDTEISTYTEAEKTDSTNTEENSRKGIVDITAIIEPFREDGLGFFRGSDGKDYLVNEEGYSLAEYEKGLFDDGVGNFINGYFSGFAHLSDVDKDFPSHKQEFYLHPVYDKNYKLIFDENDNIISPVSKSGYMMTFEVVEQLSGITEKYKIVDMNGKTVCDLGEGWFKSAGYICDDIFYYIEEGGKGVVLIDAAANKRLETQTKGGVCSDSLYAKSINGDSELNNWIRIGNTYFKKDLSGKKVAFDKSNFIGSKMDEVPLTNNRFWHEKTIYDYEGNPLKEITEGGVSEIYYYDGVYYVESENDYIYTLDSDFKYISSPRKAESGHLTCLTPLGVVLGDRLVDKNLNKIDLSIPTDSYKIYPDYSWGNYVYYNDPDDASNSRIIAYNPVNGKTIKNIITDVNAVSDPNVKPSNNIKPDSKRENLCADSSNWARWSSEENGCAANMKILSDGAALEITKSEGEYYYYNQLKYENLFLEKGITYRLEFDLETTNNISVESRVQQNYDPYHYYCGDILDASSNGLQHYSFEFTMTVTEDNAALAFNCNNFDVAAPYTVSVRNLTLVRVD